MRNDVAVARDSISNCGRNLLPVSVHHQLVHVLLVREETAFHHDGRMVHVRENKELLRFRAAVDCLRTADQRFLDKVGQTLALDVRQFKRGVLQKWQPRCDERRIRFLPRRVIGFDATGDRFFCIVEMDADTDAVVLSIRDGGAVRQRNIFVAVTRQHAGQSLRLHEPRDALRNVESEIFLENAAADGAGILAAMPRIEDDQGRGPPRDASRSGLSRTAVHFIQERANNCAAADKST